MTPFTWPRLSRLTSGRGPSSGINKFYVGFSNSVSLAGLFSLLVSFGEGKLPGLILGVDEGFLFCLGRASRPSHWY